MQGDASYQSIKEFYCIPSLALFTAAVFTCRLRPALQAVIGRKLTYFDLFGCLLVFFSRLIFNLIEPCPKLTYFCTLSLRRNGRLRKKKNTQKQKLHRTKETAPVIINNIILMMNVDIVVH